MTVVLDIPSPPLLPYQEKTKKTGGQVKDTTKEEQEETEDETGEEEEQDEECVACGYVKSDVIIMEKYERLRRCKEGGDHENYEFLNWSEPRLVATS